MEEILNKILTEISDVKKQAADINKHMISLEKRLARLEKIDSIEHRIEVNQIDLSDIKEIVEKIESYQREGYADFFEVLKGTFLKIFNEEIHVINQRLDAHLTKIAKNEEAILMLEGRNKVC